MTPDTSGMWHDSRWHVLLALPPPLCLAGSQHPLGPYRQVFCKAGDVQSFGPCLIHKSCKNMESPSGCPPWRTSGLYIEHNNKDQWHHFLNLSIFSPLQYRQGIQGGLPSAGDPWYGGRSYWLLPWLGHVRALSTCCGAPVGGGSRSQRHRTLRPVPGETQAVYLLWASHLVRGAEHSGRGFIYALKKPPLHHLPTLC